MVQESDVGIVCRPLLGGDVESLADRLLAHRGVRSKGDHHVQGGDFVRKVAVNLLENHSEGTTPCRVGNDEKNPLATHFLRGNALGDDRGNLF